MARPRKDDFEKETIIIINEAGEVTVNSNSPKAVKNLTHRLGVPNWSRGDFAQWETETALVSIGLPRLLRARKAS